MKNEKLMNKIRYIFFFFLSFFLSSAFSSSVTLLNDSPYSLTAIVQSAGGIFLGQEHLQAHEQIHWTKELIPTELKSQYSSPVSTTPFTVIWKCEYGGVYSMCSDVSPGSLVRASICPGDRYCKPKPKKQKRPEDCPPCPGEEGNSY